MKGRWQTLGRFIARIADFIRETDKLMVILCVFATSYGCLAVYSSTRYLDTLRPLLVQIIGMVVGIAAAIVISSVDFDKYSKYWYLFVLLGVIPVILLCRHMKLSGKATVLVSFIYSFYPALTMGCAYDLHENCFLAPLLLWLFYFFEKACGISGYILGVNPFDQPGVEAYKKNMFALLEKPGYEEATKAIKERLK